MPCFGRFWHPWNCVLIGAVILFSKTLSRTFTISALSWAFFIAFFSLYGLGMIEYLIREAFGILRGTGKLSDQLLFVTENVMVMGVITLTLLLANVIFNGKKPAHSIPALSQRFRSMTKWRQRILLALLFTTLFNYPLLALPGPTNCTYCTGVLLDEKCGDCSHSTGSEMGRFASIPICNTSPDLAFSVHFECGCEGHSFSQKLLLIGSETR